MDVIKTWKQGGKNYAVGVKLYVQLGSDESFKKLLLAEQETPYKKARLEKALDALMTAPVATTAVLSPTDTVETPAVASLASFTRAWPETACKSADEKKLWQEAVVLLKERAYLHAALFHQTNDDDRRRLAFQLLRKDDDLKALYEARGHLLKHGELPTAPSNNTEYVTDPFLMGKRIESLKRYIRREADPKRKAAWVEEYNHYARLIGREEKTV